MQATIFNDNINIFASGITQDCTYYISNGLIKKIPPQYKLVEHYYQMIINNYTKVEVVEEASIISMQKKYNFTPLKSTSIDPSSTTTAGINAPMPLIYQ